MEAVAVGLAVEPLPAKRRRRGAADAGASQAPAGDAAGTQLDAHPPLASATAAAGPHAPQLLAPSSARPTAAPAAQSADAAATIPTAAQPQPAQPQPMPQLPLAPQLTPQPAQPQLQPLLQAQQALPPLQPTQQQQQPLQLDPLDDEDAPVPNQAHVPAVGAAALADQWQLLQQACEQVAQGMGTTRDQGGSGHIQGAGVPPGVPLVAAPDPLMPLQALGVRYQALMDAMDAHLLDIARRVGATLHLTIQVYDVPQALGDSMLPAVDLELPTACNLAYLKRAVCRAAGGMLQPNAQRFYVATTGEVMSGDSNPLSSWHLETGAMLFLSIVEHEPSHSLLVPQVTLTPTGHHPHASSLPAVAIPGMGSEDDEGEEGAEGEEEEDGEGGGAGTSAQHRQQMLWHQIASKLAAAGTSPGGAALQHGAGRGSRAGTGSKAGAGAGSKARAGAGAGTSAGPKKQKAKKRSSVGGGGGDGGGEEGEGDGVMVTGPGRQRFTEEEIVAVVEGVRLYGTSWARIKTAFIVQLARRTQVNIKDKWRNLQRGLLTNWRDERSVLSEDTKDKIRQLTEDLTLRTSSLSSPVGPATTVDAEGEGRRVDGEEGLGGGSEDEGPAGAGAEGSGGQQQ